MQGNNATVKPVGLIYIVRDNLVYSYASNKVKIAGRPSGKIKKSTAKPTL